MSKYVDRILDEVSFNFERHFHDKDERIDFLEELIEEVNDLLEEVQFNFDRHFHDKEERVEFLEELIEELKDRLKYVKSDDECGICPEGECDCEPEVCI